MRLSKKEVETIKKVINEFFIKPDIYLFGSRLDTSKKGGDIDLFIISKDKDLLRKKVKAIARLERILNKPVDIVLHRDFQRVIEQEALKGELL